MPIRTIRLLNTQIPVIWEAIKFACAKVDEVSKENTPIYFNELLHNLLSNKSQCFVRIDDGRNIVALMITKIMVDKITGRKSLFLQALYSWKSTSDQEWQDSFEFVKEFAAHEQCVYISFESKNPRIWQLTEILGFHENVRKFYFSVRGA